MFARASVTLTYPLMVVGLVLGAALLLGGLGVAGTERTSRDLLDRLVDQATERMRAAIAGDLQGPRRISRMNAERIRIGSLDPDALEAMVPDLHAQLMAFPDVSAVLVCSPRAGTVWVERRQDGREVLALCPLAPEGGACTEWLLDAAGARVGEPLGRYEYRQDGRPWYRAAIESDSGGWCPPYPWAASGDAVPPIGTGFSLAVRDDSGGLRAVVDVGFTLEAISSYLSAIRVTENGLVFVTDSRGRLVALNDGTPVFSPDGELVPAVRSEHPVVGAAARVLAGEGGALRTGEGGVFTHAALELEGESFQIDARGLDFDWAPDWRIVTVVPEADLLTGVREVQAQLFGWGIGILIASGLVGLLLARSIVRPVVDLTRTAARIGEGDLESGFAGRGGREFALLARGLERMCEGLRERLELRSSLAVAMEVQQHMLPDSEPDHPALDIAAFSTYCDETGGDYYDFPDSGVERDPDGSILIAIGDVTGHGIGAALIMASARAAMRTRLRLGGGLGEVLADVNDVLYQDTPDGRFMTFLALRITPDGSRFDWACAGHDPPLIFTPQSGSFHEPDGGHVPLGILGDQVFEEYSAQFGPPGAVLLTGTDGIWETASPDGELYGKDRLRAVIEANRTRSAREIGEAVIADLDAFRGSSRPLDDVTMIVLKRI